MKKILFLREYFLFPIINILFERTMYKQDFFKPIFQSIVFFISVFFQFSAITDKIGVCNCYYGSFLYYNSIIPVLLDNNSVPIYLDHRVSCEFYALLRARAYIYASRCRYKRKCNERNGSTQKPGKFSLKGPGVKVGANSHPHRYVHV